MEEEKTEELSEKELSLKSIIECLLFVSDVPLSSERLAHLTGKSEEEIKEALSGLTRDYDGGGRSFKIAEIAEGFLMCTRHEFAPWIKSLYAHRNRAKLSKASLEVLSVIAYRQPITKAEIDAIRGVDCTGVVHTILEKRLIKISGRKKILGRPLLYRTTDEFLIYFGLKDLTELPRVEELRGIVEPSELSQVNESQ
jgi:segregation and condensation protein B